MLHTGCLYVHSRQAYSQHGTGNAFSTLALLQGFVERFDCIKQVFFSGAVLFFVHRCAYEAGLLFEDVKAC